MNETNPIQPPPQSEPGPALEDLVYRASLCEGNRSIRGAAARATVPLTLVVCLILGGLVALAARRVPIPQTAIQTVQLVLQEGPNLPAPAGGPASAPARPLAPTPAPAQPPAMAPPPPQLKAPPAPPAQQAPATAPTALPTVDHSRDYGSSAPGAAGAVAGTGGGQGPGTGSGPAGSGGGTGEILDLDFSQVRPKTRPPAPSYPPLARSAGIQGVVAVQIIIGPDGVPVSAHALSGPSQLRAAAETNSLAWRFQPFLLDGRAQSCRFLVTFTFRIN